MKIDEFNFGSGIWTPPAYAPQRAKDWWAKLRKYAIVSVTAAGVGLTTYDNSPRIWLPQQFIEYYVPTHVVPWQQHQPDERRFWIESVTLGGVIVLGTVDTYNTGTSATWTPTGGTPSTANFEGWGSGGGGGAGQAGGGNWGSGGGGGGYFLKAVASPASATYSVGAAVSSATNGNATTIVSPALSAGGGVKGVTGAAGGAGGTATGGDTNTTGTAGTQGTARPTPGNGGAGANGGAGGTGDATAPTNGTAPGGGGGGGGNTGVAGASSAAGRAQFTYTPPAAGNRRRRVLCAGKV